MCVLCEVCDGMVSPPFRMFLQPGKIEDDVIRCRKGSLTDAGIHPSNKVARMQNRPDFELMRSSLRAPEVVLRINFLDLRLQSLGTPWREGSPLASRPAKCGVCFSRNRLSRGQRISGTAAKPHGGLTPRGSIVMPHPPPHRPSPKLPLCNSCEAPSERIEIQHGFQDGDRRPDPPLTTHLWWLPISPDKTTDLLAISTGQGGEASGAGGPSSYSSSSCSASRAARRLGIDIVDCLLHA
ncbi:unnamed protein product [Cladocopium goreaui]|uniref:Uncharacterized protein n=1 Tax=Cladocopium goreaui TaxID=2562237 RepID=A0A9P1G710_9DINO|nr:unnamed protein product [Cladocopium goreaui]